MRELKMELTEREETLLTLYHCNHMRYYITVDTDEECDRTEYLNGHLTFNEISKIIERYNKRKYGVTKKECRKRRCLLCKNFNICENEENTNS